MVEDIPKIVVRKDEYPIPNELFFDPALRQRSITNTAFYALRLLFAMADGRGIIEIDPQKRQKLLRGLDTDERRFRTILERLAETAWIGYDYKSETLYVTLYDKSRGTVFRYERVDAK